MPTAHSSFFSHFHNKQVDPGNLWSTKNKKIKNPLTLVVLEVCRKAGASFSLGSFSYSPKTSWSGRRKSLQTASHPELQPKSPGAPAFTSNRAFDENQLLSTK